MNISARPRLTIILNKDLGVRNIYGLLEQDTRVVEASTKIISLAFRASLRHSSEICSGSGWVKMERRDACTAYGTGSDLAFNASLKNSLHNRVLSV